MSISINNIFLLPDLAVRRTIFDSGRRQAKTTLASTKADLPSLPEIQNLLLAAQKQLLELPFIIYLNVEYEPFLVGRKSICII